MTTDAAETLCALTPGQKARVHGFDLPPEQRQRIMEMGLTVGAEVELVRFAPLGDPIEIKVRGFHLSLRRQEAAGIRIVRL